MNLNKEEVAVITKKWGGVAREYATDADFFSISYSESFDTTTKALLLGALFLIEATQPIDIPPELEELNTMEQVMIKQQINIAQLAWGVQRKNKYLVMDENEHILYDALEDTTLKSRLMCPINRAFVIPVFDQNRVVVFVLSRPFRCCCLACCTCQDCLQILTVSLPNGTVLGYVKQIYHWLRPLFAVQNASGDIYLRIWGPFCLSQCYGKDVNFKVCNLEDHEVAMISKKWGGFAREYATSADIYSVTFHESMSIATKATLIGAAILLDYIFFEGRHHQGTMAMTTTSDST